MRILKNLFYLFLMIGITFLACQAKVKKLSPDEEIRLLKNLVKEKTEAAQAEMEYWQKMGLVGGLIDAQVAEVNEKQISPEAFNGLKDLKDPLFDLLASSERIGIKKLYERYDAAKKALEKYAENYIEDYVKEPEVVSIEKPGSIESETETIPINNVKEVGITMGLPPTPELPPLASPEEREEIFDVKEESMQIQPEIFEEIPPTPPSPGAVGIPAAPGMAPSMGMTPEEAPSMGMAPEPVPEMGEVEEDVEEEVEEAEPVGMGMGEPVGVASMAPGTEMPELPAPLPAPAMPEMLPAEPAEMGMMPEPEEVPPMGMEPEPVPEMGEVEEEIEETEPIEMDVEEPVGMTLGMDSPVFTGFESFSKDANIKLAMNSTEDSPDIEDDEEEIQDEEDEEDAEDDM